MYLLDTNICIAVINENPQAMAEFYPKFSQCYISTIVIAELYKGAYCSQRIEENINRVERFARMIPVFEFDRNASE